jgi:hypothetical protein
VTFGVVKSIQAARRVAPRAEDPRRIKDPIMSGRARMTPA